MRRLVPFLTLGLLLCGCDAGLPMPSGPLPTMAQFLTPTPSGPDIQTLSVQERGYGTYGLIVEPVAVVHNKSNAHAALGVVVHFVTTSGGHVIRVLDSRAVNIAPNAVAVVTADCTDGCNGTDGLRATAAAQGWGSPTQAPEITGGPVGVSCGHCGSASSGGYGVASTTLRAPFVPTGASVVVFASCRLVNGIIVGGGSTDVLWQLNGQDQAVAINIIVRARPAACQISALVAGP